MGKKPSRRKRRAPAVRKKRVEAGPKLATLPEPPPLDETARLKSAAYLMSERSEKPGTLEYAIVHAEEIAAADRERARQERAEDEFRVEQIKEALRGKERPKEPGARAGTKLTPEIIAANLAEKKIGATHADGRPVSWQDRANMIKKAGGPSVTDETVMRAVKKYLEKQSRPLSS